MASRLLFSSLRQVQKLQKACVHSRSRIGNREVVGFGLNGQYSYQDRPDFPMPAIRFKENTPDIVALREKEKGDWRKLSLEEKKALYRASFCQTFSEMTAPTGEWKSIIGLACVFISIGIWLVVLEKLFVYKDLPQSFSEENKKAQLERIIQIRANPIEGISSKYDYEKGQWK
ncbi:cytochrome c oxidase subunit 4 isoform 1, mitochondrial-like [Periplaneta americana]|uniref:cytochrome c oxidase subunit 4 isoform 1, mitochondrial-like n=1 Tax=Periplaneta americana TaxID=6978 RepID=UPI0037E87CE7